MKRELAAFFLLAACGAASSARPIVSAAEASRREACVKTRERWESERNRALTGTAWRRPAGDVCECGNGKIDVCRTTERDCPGGNPHACDGIPVVERSFSEVCDGKDLGGMTCERLGFAGGALTCSPGCALDTSACEWLPLGARSVPLSPSEPLTAMIANEEELLVITAPLQKTSPITARRYDRELRVVGETTLEGSFDGVAAVPHGFIVAVRDDFAKPLRKSAIYDVSSPSPLFAFDDGRVVSMWTVRSTDKTLRDPIALLTYPTSGYQLLRVRRGERPVATSVLPSAQWQAEAVETPSGIVLPAGLFEPLVRVRADGTSEQVTGPEACPVHARYAPGWLAWVGSDMRASIVPVDDALRPRGAPSSFDERLDAPVFLGDWLWLGGNDFVRRDAGAAIVHVARGPALPIMLTPFVGALAIVWNRGPSALTLVQPHD